MSVRFNKRLAQKKLLLRGSGSARYATIGKSAWCADKLSSLKDTVLKF